MADEPFWGLALPFTVVQSEGGPYEDRSFVAGFAAGRIYGMLEQGEVEGPQLVKRGLLPQLDLIAMKYGYVTTYTEVAPVEGDEDWVQVSFVRPSEEAISG